MDGLLSCVSMLQSHRFLFNDSRQYGGCHSGIYGIHVSSLPVTEFRWKWEMK